jgi:hypothetical protein
VVIRFADSIFASFVRVALFRETNLFGAAAAAPRGQMKTLEPPVMSLTVTISP